MKTFLFTLLVASVAANPNENTPVEVEGACPENTIPGAGGDNGCYRITERAINSVAIADCDPNTETLVTDSVQLQHILDSQSDEQELWTDCAECTMLPVDDTNKSRFCEDSGNGPVCKRSLANEYGIPYTGKNINKCIAFKYQNIRRTGTIEPLFVVRECDRYCAAVCRSERPSVLEYCESSRVVSFNGKSYGFWMWKTTNNAQNGNKDNKQTFRGGDGFCQGKKASLPHLYNSAFVAAAENEVKSKLGLTSLGNEDTFWSALSWNIPGQISRRRKRSPQAKGGSAKTCQNAACENEDGLLWERHQTRGDTVDFTFVAGTFTQLDMTEFEAGLYVPSDTQEGTGLIESHPIQANNDKHYVLCMHAC